MHKPKPAFRYSPTNPDIAEIQTKPKRYREMPYAPAMRVGELLFISGATASPLYHRHPHVLREHDHPNGVQEQTRRAMETIKSILTHQGLEWTDVGEVTKYLTDMRDQDEIGRVLNRYFGDWKPTSTMVCVNQLSTPGARIEIEMLAAYRGGPERVRASTA